MSRRKHGEIAQCAVNPIKRPPADDRTKTPIAPRIRPEDQDGILWKADNVRQHLV